MSDKSKSPQMGLFGDDELKEITITPAELVKLQIQKGIKPKLSKEQNRFNRLVKQIDNLKATMELVKSNAVELRQFHAQHIIPVQHEIGNAYFELIEVIDVFLQNSKKFSKKQQELIDAYLWVLFDEALTYIEPNEKQKALFAKYNDETYEDIVNEQVKGMYDNLREMMKDFTGMDMGEMDFDPFNMESMQKFANKFKEKIDETEEKYKEDNKNRKKTKKELEREQQELIEAELQKKSIRNIYISLAKALHPDTDTDTDEQKSGEKAELMKKVNAAYKRNDLSELLKLEMEWIHRTAANLEALTDEKLKLYNEILQEQVYELQSEMTYVVSNPEYSDFSQWLTNNLNYAKSKIKNILKDYKTDLKALRKDIKYLSTNKLNRTQWLRFIEERTPVMWDEDDEEDLLSQAIRKIIWES